MCKRYIDHLPLAHPKLGTQTATHPGALTGNQIRDPLVHSLALDPLSHTNQGGLVKFLMSSCLSVISTTPYMW